MAERDDSKKSDRLGFSIGLSQQANEGPITARRAGEIADLRLCVSPVQQPVAKALRNLAKALNLALQDDFIETPLDGVYKAARVRHGAVQILHRDYIGLGDGVFASLGKAAKSFSLTLKGPDAASPEGQAWIEKHGGGAVGGVFNLLGRKLDFLQEFEDKVPTYVEQTLDRLEATHTITDWSRDEWRISTTVIGLDVRIHPAIEPVKKDTASS